MDNIIKGLYQNVKTGETVMVIGTAIYEQENLVVYLNAKSELQLKNTHDFFGFKYNEESSYEYIREKQ